MEPCIVYVYVYVLVCCIFSIGRDVHHMAFFLVAFQYNQWKWSPALFMFMFMFWSATYFPLARRTSLGFLPRWSLLFNKCCGLQAVKYCANSPLVRIGAQVPAWLAPMTDKQSLRPARAGRIN
jgi:hypothetical protein